MPASPKPVSVLLMARELGPGGTERQLTEIAKRLDRARFCPHVAFFRRGFRSEELEEAGIPCHEIGIRSFATPDVVKHALAFKRFLQLHKIDIVHTFDYPLTCFAVPIARAASGPVVLSSQRGHRSLIPPHYRQLIRITDLLVDGIVVNCVAMREHLVHDEDIPRSNIHLCYNGLDLDQIDSNRIAPGRVSPNPEDLNRFETESLLQQSTLANSHVTLGCISVLRREKNLHLLLLSAAELLPSVPNLRVLMVGSGPEEAHLRQLAARLGIVERCQFQAAEKNIVPWLSQIDIFVLPSSTEALSNSLMEAMASDCAVVASNVGGTPELIIHGETGLLFASENVSDLTRQLSLLIRTPLLRTSLAVKARALLQERFTLDQSAACMSEIYSLHLETRLKAAERTRKQY